MVATPANNQQRMQSLSQSIVEGQAAVFDFNLTQLRSRLEAYANIPSLQAPLTEEGQQPAMEQNLAQAFPEAHSVRLISLGPLGIASLKKDQVKLRNNIELDLLRRASSGEQVDPEAYLYDKQWLFSAVQAIKSTDGQVVGALVVTFDENYLLALISQLDSSLGQTAILQKFSNKSSAIASQGTGSNRYTSTADTSVPHLLLSFNPSNTLVTANTHSAQLLWIIFAVSVANIFFITGYCLFNSLKSIGANLARLLDTKAQADSREFDIPGFADCDRQLRASRNEMLKLARQSGPAKSSDDNAKQTVEKKADSTPAPTPTPERPPELPAHIFRAYDIRGIADSELTDPVVTAIGMAIGSEALDQGQQTLVVAADGHHSSPRIRDTIVKGLLASGRDVIDIGATPTPLMYFATHQLGTQSGVMITGSHNPAEYNGLKIVIGGQALSGNAIQALQTRILNQQLASGSGHLQTDNIDQSYLDFIVNDVAIAQPLKIVVDTGNGITGNIAPRLFEELGCEVEPLFCEVDGDFPNHHPDPSVEANMQDLAQAVIDQSADLGIAFDGDGDRLGVVTASGEVVAPDRLLMLLAQDVVSRNPGADVIFDVKCTRSLNSLISNYGGRPIMWKSGHSFMKEKMIETGALLGGEYSGHIFFKERWFGFDDGMYAAARLIEILSTTDPDLEAQLEAFPVGVSTPEWT